jgi:hypothetical protein
MNPHVCFASKSPILAARLGPRAHGLGGALDATPQQPRLAHPHRGAAARGRCDGSGGFQRKCLVCNKGYTLW